MNWLRDSLILLGLAAVVMVIAMLVSDHPRAGVFGAGATGVAGAFWFAFRGFYDDLARASHKGDRDR